MTKFDAKAYAKQLVERGIDPEAAASVARKTEEAQKAANATTTEAPATAAPKKQSKAKTASQTKRLPAKKSTLTKSERKIVDTGLRIAKNEPGNDDMTFMHSIMCQVGFPRSKMDGYVFERICGGAGLYIRAGKIWDGRQFVQQPLPYGPMPRLVMAYLNTQALRFQSPEIEIGSSASNFLKLLGKDSSGGKNGTYTTFRKQFLALSASSVTLGFTTATKAITYDGKPIKQFQAWLADNEKQGTLWPSTIQFSEEYFQTLTNHAVPLDLRALNALAASSLAMDIYVMLADQLHRISGHSVFLRWRNLREQFGQEYSGPEADKNFKKMFLPALNKVLTVYPKAQVSQVKGGILMMPSSPPIPYKA